MQEEFSSEYVPKSNWYSFDKVGCYIKGTLVNRYIQAGVDIYPDQEVFELDSVETEQGIQDGTWLVGISMKKSYVISRLKNAKLGQRMGLKYAEDIPAKVKGYRPAKSIIPYLWGMDETYKVVEEFDGEVVEDAPPFK